MPATSQPALGFYQPARPAQFDRGAQHRRAMLAKVQIARQQLRICEDDYRAILMDETGRLSCKDMDEAGLAKVLKRMERLGFKAVPKGGKSRVADYPMARKARALWISLHQLGVVRNPSEQAFEAFAKRQLKCEVFSWARQSEGYKLIEALKDMANRAGWDQSASSGSRWPSPVLLQERLCIAIVRKLHAAGIVPANWTLNDAAWKLCGELMSGPVSAEQYQRLAAALGAKLRDAGTTGAGGAA